MSYVRLYFQGWFGNQIMQYLHARAYAEKYGAELQIVDWRHNSPWLFEHLFGVDVHTIAAIPPENVRGDIDSPTPLIDGEVDISLVGYRQYQKAMIYTKEQAIDWLPFHPHVEERLRKLTDMPEMIFHVRHGDYFTHPMPVVSTGSYQVAARQYGYDPDAFTFLEQSQAKDRQNPFDSNLLLLPDFYRMMQAKVLFRSNSTYAWAAALLGHAKTYSPIVSGKPWGRLSDCQFIEGNWAAMYEQTAMNRELHLP